MDLGTEIKQFFEGDIDDSPETIAKYSKDASLFLVKPSLVVFPKNTEDIKKLVKFVNQSREKGINISLTPRAAGTDMSGGPLTESIVVEMTRYFHHIKDISDDSATVEPGTYYRDFEKETLRHDLLLPTYPASRELCTVGGMVANNSGGEKTLHYGKTEDYIRELKMVLHDGNEYVFKKLTAEELKEKINQDTVEGGIYKKLFAIIQPNIHELIAAKPDVTKNSAGYFLWNVYSPSDGTFDITKLITGSQGTFGIITEITFRLIKPEPESRVLVIFLKDMATLPSLIENVLKYHPESFELYDDNTLKLAIKFFPEIIQRIKGGLLKIAWSFIPELWMLITGGIPKLVLLAEFTGQTGAEAEGKTQVAYDELVRIFKSKMRVTKSRTETEELQVIRRESFSLLRQHIRGLRTAPFIDDFAVNPKYLPEMLEKLYKILGKYSLLYTVAGHAGDGNLHIIPLMNLSKPGTKDVIVNLSVEIYDLVLSYRGTITAEHNDGIIRTPFLIKQFGEKIYNYFVETKKIFDPDNIFNPGKKVGATMEYARDHISEN